MIRLSQLFILLFACLLDQQLQVLPSGIGFPIKINDLIGLCWNSQNALLLEQKEKREKELRIQIIEEAEEFKRAFYEKRKHNVETNKVENREKEKVISGMRLLTLYTIFSVLNAKKLILMLSSYSWLIKRSSTRMRTSKVGKQQLSSFPMRFPTLRKREARRIRTRNHRSWSFRDQSLENPLIFQGCDKYC